MFAVTNHLPRFPFPCTIKSLQVNLLPRTFYPNTYKTRLFVTIKSRRQKREPPLNIFEYVTTINKVKREIGYSSIALFDLRVLLHVRNTALTIELLGRIVDYNSAHGGHQSPPFPLPRHPKNQQDKLHNADNLYVTTTAVPVEFASKVKKEPKHARVAVAALLLVAIIPLLGSRTYCKPTHGRRISIIFP